MILYVLTEQENFYKVRKFLIFLNFRDNAQSRDRILDNV
jgi:hypothetical protein